MRSDYPYPHRESMATRAFVFLEIFSQEGGIQSYVHDVLQQYLALSEQAASLETTEIFLLRDAADGNNPFKNSPIRFHYFKQFPAWKGRVRLAFALLGYLIQRRPEQVICGHIKLAPLVQRLCQLFGVSYTVMTYGKEVWTQLPRWEHQALQQADEIWTISRYSRDCLCQANDIPPKKVEIVPCIVDGDHFTPGKSSVSLRQQYGLVNATVLMTVARLWSGDIYKGVDVTIRALPKILQRFPEVKYLVIGRGDDRPRLENLAKELGVGDRVIFAGFVATEALIDHYRLADAYVMPSQEGFGIVYMEAMACGIPVLSGDADGSADPLQDGRVGWRVPHRDPEAVATACIEILQGQDQRCNGVWLREQTLTHFSPRALREKLGQLL